MKRSMILFAVLVGGMVLTTVAAADDAADVIAASQDLVKALNEADAEGYAQHFLPDRSGFGTTGLLFEEGVDVERRKADIEAGLEYDIRWRHLQVRFVGDVAIVTGYGAGSITLPNDGPTIKGPWQVSHIRVKQGGKWKIAHSHVSRVFPSSE